MYFINFSTLCIKVNKINKMGLGMNVLSNRQYIAYYIRTYLYTRFNANLRGHPTTYLVLSLQTLLSEHPTKNSHIT